MAQQSQDSNVQLAIEVTANLSYVLAFGSREDINF